MALGASGMSVPEEERNAGCDGSRIIFYKHCTVREGLVYDDFTQRRRWGKRGE